MANFNAKGRKRLGTPRSVKLTLPDEVWEVIDGDDVSQKTGEKVRLMLMAYLGFNGRGVGDESPTNTLARQSQHVGVSEDGNQLALRIGPKGEIQHP